MGEFLHLSTRRCGSRGTVHVWRKDDSKFEIGQESASGNSWGSFETFDDAQSAVAAAYRLNREVYGGQCDVRVDRKVMACLPSAPKPARDEL